MIKELSDNILIPLSNIEDPAQLNEVNFSSVLVKTHTKVLKPANITTILELGDLIRRK